MEISLFPGPNSSSWESSSTGGYKFGNEDHTHIVSLGVLFIVSSRQLSFVDSCWLFLFLGAESFYLMRRPHFMSTLDDTFACTVTTCQTGTLVHAGTFLAGMYKLVILVVSTNASGI